MITYRTEQKIKALRQLLDEADMFLGGPARDEDISSLISMAAESLCLDIPEEYLEFLRSYDGLVSGGVFMYSSRAHKYSDSDGRSPALIEQNLIARDVDFMSAFLVLGESDQDEYVYALKNNVYQVRDRQAFDVVIEEFAAFEGLLEYVVDLVGDRN
ncbi:YrhA family protein [Pseudomonas sp. LB3P31]